MGQGLTHSLVAVGNAPYRIQPHMLKSYIFYY